MTKEEFIHGVSQKDIVYLADGNILKLMPRGSNISLSNNNPSMSTAIQIQLKNVDDVTNDTSSNTEFDNVLSLE